MSTKEAVLNVKERKDFGSANSRRFRREGAIPVVVYSHGSDAKSFCIPQLQWDTLLRKGDVHLVKLKADQGQEYNALIKDVQHDYLSGTTLHIDFLEVKMDEVITAKVPVYPKGVAIGTSHDGVLEQVMHEIEVKCLPANIPSSIEVDVTNLDIDQAIFMKDIVLPEKVSPATPLNQVVFHVIRLRVEAEPTPAAEGVPGEVPAGEAAPVEPELVGGKGKEKEPGEEDEQAEKGKDKAKEKDKDKGKEKK